MLTEKDYCDYETCVALMELGFTLDMTEKKYERNLACCRYEDVPKPTLYEAQKWLREERNIDILPRRGCITNDKQRYQVVIYINYNRNQILLDNDGEDYSSPEEALSEGIKEAIKILK